jgi:hypothetical protein
LVQSDRERIGALQSDNRVVEEFVQFAVLVELKCYPKGMDTARERSSKTLLLLTAPFRAGEVICRDEKLGMAKKLPAVRSRIVKALHIYSSPILTNLDLLFENEIVRVPTNLDTREGAFVFYRAP